MGITERKRAKIENPFLNAYLQLKINSQILCQENPSNGLGGVAIMNLCRTSKEHAPNQEIVKHVFFLAHLST